MKTKFGRLLRSSRQSVGLTQKNLGDKIKRDVSIISRLETGQLSPNLDILNDIVLAFADLLPRENLESLWEAADFYITPTFDKPVSDPIVASIHNAFERLSSEEERIILKQDLLSMLKIDQEYFEAEKVRKKKKWDEAAEALMLIRSQMDRRIQVWYLRVDQELGDCFYSNISFSQALWNYRSALMSAQQLKDEHKQGEILIKIGNVYRRRGGKKNCGDARQYYNDARKIFVSLPKGRIPEAECLRKSAGAWIFEGRPDEAEKLCEQSLKICKSENYKRGQYKALQHKAWACSMLGRWDEAVRLCEEALDMTEDGWDEIKGYRYLGDAFRIAGRLDEARGSYQKALNLMVERDIKHSRTYGLIQLGLAKVCLRQPGLESEAKQYLDEGLKIHGGQGEDFRAIDFYVEHSYLLLKLRRLEEAKPLLELAMHQYEELDNIFNYARTLALLCELLYEEKKVDSLNDIQNIAKSAKEKDNGLINYYLAQIDFISGKAFADRRQFQDASRVWSLALGEALGFNSTSFNELAEKIFVEIERIMRETTPDEAYNLCNYYKVFLENSLSDKKWKPTDRDEIETLLRKIDEQQKHIYTLTPTK